MFYGSLYPLNCSDNRLNLQAGTRMNITLNGDTFDVPEGTSLAELISQLELEGKRFAIEVNEEIITRSEHASYQLNQGDQVEVVQAIGGG